jgi:hypothetical protein
MHKRIDFQFLGGYPLTQDSLAHMQDAYSSALGALAQLCGDKTILAGVEINGANVSAGWISYACELIPFIGGVLAAQVKITTTPTPLTFEDNVTHDVEFSKVAELVAVGDFDFADLQPLLSLKNIWKKDDLRMCKKDSAYIAANFDANTGIGITPEERGWQILSKQDVDAAGKAFVNVDENDFIFSEAGYYGGEKQHQLNVLEMPSHSHKIYGNDNDATPVTPNGEVANIENGADFFKNSETVGGNQPHNNLQPYYVVLTLIKL